MDDRPTTLDECIAIDPRIGQIINQASRHPDKRDADGHFDWKIYSQYKMELSRIVGLWRGHGISDKRLHSSDVYDICIAALCDALWV